jgi:Domain of unknown function (DUF4328)
MLPSASRERLAYGGAAWHFSERVSYSPPPESQAAPAPEPIAAAGLYSPDGRWYWDGARWTAVAASPPAWARPYAPPESRATAAATLVGVAVGATGLLLLAQSLVIVIVLTSFGGSALGSVASLLGTVAFFLSWASLVGGAIAVPMWMHRCFRNLPALSATPRGWSPAWAVWGWFIPLANLVIPYLVARELWRQVHLDGRSPLPAVGVWWAAWVLALIGQVVNGTVLAATLVGFVGTMVADVVTVAAGVLLIVIIRQVTRRQRMRYAQLHTT